VATQWFKHEDRAIILLGVTEDDLGASEYALVTRGRVEGRVPRLDLELERRVQEACLKIIQAGLVESAHDCSDGGLSVAIAESAFSSYRKEAVGCEVNIEGDLSQAALLFSETPSRIVLSAELHNTDNIFEITRAHNISALVIGRTGGDRLVINVNGETVVNRSVAEVESAWRGVLPQMLEVSSLIAAEESLTS